VSNPITTDISKEAKKSAKFQQAKQAKDLADQLAKSKIPKDMPKP
jgi:hypothetical protein